MIKLPNRFRHALAALLAVVAALGASPAAALRIVTPAPEETIHDNSGTVAVIVAGAKPGDRLRPVLDGVASAQSHVAPAFELQGVPRGTHQLAVERLDADGRAIERTPAVTFFVWQARA